MAYPAIRLGSSTTARTTAPRNVPCATSPGRVPSAERASEGPALHRRPGAPPPVGGRRRDPQRTDPRRAPPRRGSRSGPPVLILARSGSPGSVMILLTGTSAGRTTPTSPSRPAYVHNREMCGWDWSGTGSAGGTSTPRSSSRREGVELAGVVTRSPDRRAELAADLPGVPAYDSSADLLAAGVDAVTITTPPHTRRTLVLQAIAAGVPTIADKPFAAGRGGRAGAGRRRGGGGRSANVFHNRRWDADIRTLAAVLRGRRAGRALARRVPDGPGQRGHAGGRPRRAGCSATWAATWSTRCSGCSARPAPSTPSWTTSSPRAAAPTAASPCPSPTPAGSAPACPPARSITSRTASCAPTAAPAPTWPTAPTCRPRPSSPAGARSTRATLGLRRPRALGHAAHRRRVQAGAVRTGRLPGLLHPVRRRAARRRRFPVPRRAGRAHPRGAGRRPDQRRREPGGRPPVSVAFTRRWRTAAGWCRAFG